MSDEQIKIAVEGRQFVVDPATYSKIPKAYLRDWFGPTPTPNERGEYEVGHGISANVIEVLIFDRGYESSKLNRDDMDCFRAMKYRICLEWKTELMREKESREAILEDQKSRLIAMGIQIDSLDDIRWYEKNRQLTTREFIARDKHRRELMTTVKAIFAQTSTHPLELEDYRRLLIATGTKIDDSCTNVNRDDIESYRMMLLYKISLHLKHNYMEQIELNESEMERLKSEIRPISSAIVRGCGDSALN